MYILLLLAFSWLVTYLLVGSSLGALMIVIIASAAVLGMGSRLKPEGGAVAVAAILVGALMSNLGLGQYLIPALAAGLALGIFWQVTRKPGSADSPRLAGTA